MNFLTIGFFLEDDSFLLFLLVGYAEIVMRKKEFHFVRIYVYIVDFVRICVIL